jgi:hypothetical protein
MKHISSYLDLSVINVAKKGLESGSLTPIQVIKCLEKFDNPSYQNFIRELQDES